MPLVRCPDCCRDIEVSREELAGVIECATCEARFGPLLRLTAPASPPQSAPPPPTPATDHVETASSPVDAAALHRRGRRIKPKSLTRFLPIVLGILLGLGGTAAVAGSIYLALKYGQTAVAPEPSGATAPASASKRPAQPNSAR